MTSIMVIIEILIASFFGLLFGNYATTVYHRIPLGKPINGLKALKGQRPHCSTCSHPLKFYEYLPLLSWFCTKFRCNYCGVQTDWAYTLLEVAGLVTSVILSLLIGFSQTFIFMLGAWITYFLLLVLCLKYSKIYLRVLAAQTLFMVCLWLSIQSSRM